MSKLESYVSYMFDYPKGKYYDQTISKEDINTLRSLARRVRDISQHPCQKERTVLWKKINSLEKCRPPVFFRLLDLYWPEFYSWDNLKTTHPWARYYEDYLIKKIWHWDNLKDDYVTEAKIYYDTAGKFGKFISSKKTSVSGYNKGSGSYKVETALFESMKPEDYIIDTEVSVDWEETNKREQWLLEVFDGILEPVRNSPSGSFSYFDHFCETRGMANAMMDFIVRPKYVHDLFQYITDFYIAKFKKLEELNALALNNDGRICYNGGPSFTDELPSSDYKGKVRTKDMWGLGVAQSAVSISPDMHEEFVTKYERQVLKLFGLNTIGCCETVDRKMHLYRTIPNLRRISVSAFNDFEMTAKEMGADFIFSLKPRTNNVAGDNFDKEIDYKYLKEVLETAKNCRVEIIQQEIITCRNQPMRLIKWCEAAMKASKEIWEKYN